MNEREMRVFDSAEFGRIRAFSQDGEPWFVAKDVCAALGYRAAPDMTRTLFDDEKDMHTVRTLGGAQKVTIISEPGFYHAVMQRRSACIKDEGARQRVEAFQRWVTHEVLPAIRRDGGYMVLRPEETPEQLMARALTVANETLRRERERADALEAENGRLKPKALFADAVSSSDGTCLVGVLAKMIRQNGVDMGQNRLFEWMREHGYLGKEGSNRNVPTQRAMDMGLFKVKETAVTHSDGHVTLSRTAKVTGKGQVYFMEKLGALR